MDLNQARGKNEFEEAAKRNRKLYEQYAQPLEQIHKGKYIAISNNGSVIIGANDVQVAKDAVEKFGAGRFAFFKIGARAVGKWRNTSAQL